MCSIRLFYIFIQYETSRKPAHILESSASCIDLIFTNQPNIVMFSGLHLSLHEKCHHQIIFLKLNLKTEYPPPYTRKIGDYNRSEADSTNRTIEIFDWSYYFQVKMYMNK